MLSVIVPAYCEGPTIARSPSTIAAVLHGMGPDFELIVVDDGSTDDTWDYIEQVASDHPQVRAIQFARNFGKDAAIFAGLESAAGEAVLVMDGDLQHPPELIPELYEIWASGGAEVRDDAHFASAHPFTRSKH